MPVIFLRGALSGAGEVECCGGGRNRIAVPTHGDKSRYHSTSSPLMTIGRGGNSIAPVFPPYAHGACLTSVQKDDAHPGGGGVAGARGWCFDIRHSCQVQQNMVTNLHLFRRID